MGDILINMIVYTSSGIINYSFWADTGVCPYKTAFPLNPRRTEHSPWLSAYTADTGLAMRSMKDKSVNNHPKQTIKNHIPDRHSFPISSIRGEIILAI